MNLLSFRNVAEAQIWKSKYSTEAVARIEVAHSDINALMSRKRIFDVTSNFSPHLEIKQKGMKIRVASLLKSYISAKKA